MINCFFFFFIFIIFRWFSTCFNGRCWCMCDAQPVSTSQFASFGVWTSVIGAHLVWLRFCDLQWSSVISCDLLWFWILKSSWFKLISEVTQKMIIIFISDLSQFRLKTKQFTTCCTLFTAKSGKNRPRTVSPSSRVRHQPAVLDIPWVNPMIIFTFIVYLVHEKL